MTYTVCATGCTHSNLASAYAAAGAADTIELRQDIADEPLNVNKPIAGIRGDVWGRSWNATGSGAGFHTLQISAGLAQPILIQNLSINHSSGDGQGIHISAFSAGTPKVTLKNVNVRRTSATAAIGVFVDPAPTVADQFSADGCVFSGNNTGSAMTINSMSTDGGILLYNCVFYDATAGILLQGASAATTIRIHNCTFYDCTAGLQASTRGDFVNNLFAGNTADLLIGAPGSIADHRYTSFQQQALTGTGVSNLTVNSATEFVLPGSANFQLLPGALSRDSGQALTFSADALLNARPQGGGWDRGAYEFPLDNGAAAGCDPLSRAGNAQAAGSGVTLTAALGGQKGAAWYGGLLDLTQAFDLTHYVYAGSDPNGADGFAFVLQDDPRGMAAIGAGGGGVGYTGPNQPQPSVAFTFDTFGNNGLWNYMENGGAACGFVSSGSCGNEPPNSLKDGKYHSIRVTWTPGSNFLRLYVDGSLALQVTRNLSSSVFYGRTSVRPGFTAATGGLSNEHAVYPAACFTPSCQADFGHAAVGADTIFFTGSNSASAAFVVGEGQTLHDIQVYTSLPGPSAMLHGAIYGTSAGQPANKIVETNTVAPGSGWQTLEFNDVTVAAGVYWISLHALDVSIQRDDIAPGRLVLAWGGSFQDPYPGGATYNLATYSAFVNTSCGVNLTPTPTFSRSPTFSATPTPACPGSIGKTSTGATPFSFNGTVMIASAYSLPVPATIQSLGIRVANLNLGTPSLRAALYNNSGGNPGTLITESASVGAVAGLNTVDIPDTFLAPGIYWLAFQADDVDISRDNNTSPGNRNAAQAYGAFPASFPAPTNSANAYDVLANYYCGAASPTPSPSPSHTASPTRSPTRTLSPTPTRTDSQTASPTGSPTGSPSHSPTPTRTPQNGDILFISGGPAGISDDSFIVARIQSLGFNVVIMDDNAADVNAAYGKALVYISESIQSTLVTSTFRNVTIPVVSSESYVFDDMNMTGPATHTDYEVAGPQSDIVILNPSHYLADGNPAGPLSVATAGDLYSWGAPAPSADIIAGSLTDTARAVIFAYETGLTMVGGFVAPARRLGFMLEEDTAGGLTAAGLGLLDRAILWAAGAAPATPTPTSSPSSTHSPTRSPTPTHTPTWSPTSSPSASPTRTDSQTASPTASPSPTGTPTASPTRSPSPSITETATRTHSITATHTPTLTLTGTNSPTPTHTPTATPTGSPSSTITPTATRTHSTSPSHTPTLTQTSTFSPTSTPSPSLSSSSTATRSSTPSFTATLTGTPTISRSPTFTPSPTPTLSISSTQTQTLTLTQSPVLSPTPSKTPGGWTASLRLFNEMGQLVRSLPAGPSGQGLADFTFSSNPWDPVQPLLISEGAWSFSLTGVDDQGAPLAGGNYVLILDSTDGSAAMSASKALSINGSAKSALDSAFAAPSPAGKGANYVDLFWMPASLGLAVQIFNEAGERIAEPASIALGRARWELKGAANGIYVAAFKVPGQRHPKIVKLALAR